MWLSVFFCRRCGTGIGVCLFVSFCWCSVLVSDGWLCPLRDG